MKYISALVCLCFVAITSAEFGYYVPKAFYTIDANGHQSELSLISPHSQQKILHRLRRAAQFSSASSSASSSTSSNGGPVYFQQSTTNQVSPSNGFSSNGLYPGLAGSLADRFGPDDSQSGVGNGVYTQTSGIVYPNGQVHYSTNTGRIRK